MARLADALIAAVEAPGTDLAPAALAIARIEYPRLDTARYLDLIDALGEQAHARIGDEPGHDAAIETRIDRLIRFLHGELGFTGNRRHYDDPRNSCLNQVLERRTGLPITLSVVYLDIARRAGLSGDGIGFPGHFLLRLMNGTRAGRSVIVDPFDDGATLDEAGCRALLARELGSDVALRPEMLTASTRREIVVRMLYNLKRLYVQMRSFPQARIVTDLVLSLVPDSLTELRDRGLLAYHLEDFNGALRDLEAYLRRSGGGGDEDEKAEAAQTWEHVKTLRRRVAGFN